MALAKIKAQARAHARPISSDLSAPCAVNILLKTLIHTLLFHVHTHALHVLHLVCVYLDAPGCLTTPTHFTSPLLFLSALPECIGSDFEDFSASCLPEGMWSLWLIRGSPVSDCPQPPLSVPLPRFNTFFYTSASPSQTPCCKSGPPVHQDLRRDARALRRTADT